MQVNRRDIVSSIVALGFATPALARAGDQQQLVDAATATFTTLLIDKDMDWLRANIRRAKAVIIAPSVVRAGFIFGGSGGHAVMLVRRGRQVTGPAFYSLGTASIGLQAGVSDSQVLTLVMSDVAVDSVLKGNFKVGGDVSAAAGPVGAGAKSDIDADFITFARAKGLYGGLNFEGTRISADSNWNAAYYGDPTLTPGVILQGGKLARQPGADRLRAVVQKYAR